MNRREWLRIIGAGTAALHIAEALAKGDLPSGIHQLDGSATVHGRSARAGEPVSSGDRVATGAKSQAIIVVGGDAFLMRSKSAIELKGNGSVLRELAVAGGQVLSVFAKKPLAITAANASIGIRGTAAYIEIDPASVYFCLCYGEAFVEGPGIEGGRVVKTTHHEQPLLLHDEGGSIRVEPGPFRDHTDAELVMLEALVGRVPPFTKDATYPAGKY
jgi:hypothetical protein